MAAYVAMSLIAYGCGEECYRITWMDPTTLRLSSKTLFWSEVESTQPGRLWASLADIASLHARHELAVSGLVDPEIDGYSTED